MDIRKFGKVFKQINKVPIDYEDDAYIKRCGKRNYHKESLDVSYSYTSKLVPIFSWNISEEVRLWAIEYIDTLRKKEPYVFLTTFTSDSVPKYPIVICDKVIDNEELFAIRNDVGPERFIEKFNKTLLYYFTIKVEKAKENNIDNDGIKTYNKNIEKLKGWFEYEDIDHSTIESFIDEKRLPLERKITNLKDNGGQPQYQKKTDKREENHGQEGKQPLIDFKKLIPQDIQWKQIEIRILDEDAIKFKYPGGSIDVRFSQTQNFVNKTTAKCNNSWKLLLELSLIECFQPNNQTYKILTRKPGKAKNRVYALGKGLMDEFGIIEKPFLHYNSQDGWLPKFTIRDLRKNHYRVKTAAEIYKSQQSLKRKQHPSTTPVIGDTYSSDDLDSYANEQKDHKDKLDHKEKGFHHIAEDEL